MAGSAALTQPGPPAAVSAQSGITVRASDPGTGAVATVRYLSRLWGLELHVRLTGMLPGTRCELWVVGPGGRDSVAGTWTVAGYSTGTWYPASSPLPATEVRAFMITSGSATLVTVPVRPA